MQLRAYVNTRDAMRTDKEKERDFKYATTESDAAKLVAKVQYMVQRDLSPEDMEEDKP
jgi:hypothetical protein